MKIVLLPVKVPSGEYCYDGFTFCGHFDNDRNLRCTHNIGYLEEGGGDFGVVKKPKECLVLKEQS